jgi:hypothetical protein
MRRGRFCILSIGLACSACEAGCSVESGSPPVTPIVADVSTAGDHSAAEYAFRWILPRAGLDSAQQVIDALRGSAGLAKPAKARTIAYYAVANPSSLPEGYEANLRRRSDRKDGDDIYEYTYKVRGPAPRPASLSSPSVCTALSVPVEEETDFTVRAEAGATKANVSLSCSIETSSEHVPEGFQRVSPTPRPCKISMARSKLEWTSVPRFADASLGAREAIKIEAWTFQSSAGETHSLLEVSWKASTAPADARKFRELIQPLLVGADDAAPPSKEKMAEQCDSGHW